MATWTMQRSGNKSVLSGTASSPWYDGSTQTALNSKPGNGDTIALAGFDLTFDENTTIGTSVAASNVISGSGNVTLSASVTLVCRGLFTPSTSKTLTMGNGSVIEFDASTTTPTSTKYGLVIGYAAHFVCGTGCEIRSNAGGGVGYVDINQAGRVDFAGMLFTRIGDLNQFAIRLQTVTTDVADSRFILTDCVFDTCGMKWIKASMAAGRRCEIKSNREVATVGTTGTVYSLGYSFAFSYCVSAPAATGVGTRLFEKNTCRKATLFTVPSAWPLVKENAFLGQVFTFSQIAGFPSFLNNLNVQNSTVTGTGTGILGNHTNTYHVADSTITDNWHALSNNITEDTLFDGMIYDAVGVVNSSDGGELVSLTTNAVSPIVATIRRCIGLPSMSNQNGDTSYRASCGALTWGNGSNSNLTMDIEHCTHYSLFAKGADNAIFATGESFGTHAGVARSLQANLPWSTKAGSAQLAVNRGFGGIGTTPDIATTAGHNGIFNGAPSYSGTPGVGYYYVVSATTPGTGDVTSDPGFVDPWRNIATWAVTLGYSGTNDQLLTFACEYISADCSLIGTRLAALLAYVRAGFRPTNLAYKAASYTTDPSTTDADGNAWTGVYPDIGAMAWIAGSSGGTSTTISLDDDPGFGIFASGTAIYF